MTTGPRDEIGALAAELRAAIASTDAATDRMRAAERAISDTLVLLFPEWRPLFPSGRDWRFSDPDGIHVYGVIDSPAAADALHRAGFRRVTAHDHPSEPSANSPCKCATRVSDHS